MTDLIEATDAHFAWMLGEATRPDGLQLPEGGVEPPGVLRWPRRGRRADPEEGELIAWRLAILCAT